MGHFRNAGKAEEELERRMALGTETLGPALTRDEAKEAAINGKRELQTRARRKGSAFARRGDKDI